jgi:hypothetical protein
MPESAVEGDLLRVRFRGPAVHGGRIALADLGHFGGKLQGALNRVALELIGRDGAGRSRRKKFVREACRLEVIALRAGSFELALGLGRRQGSLPGMDPGEAALESLIGGIESLRSGGAGLPVGYNPDVVADLREAGSLLRRGVEAIELDLRTSRKRIRAVYDREVYHKLTEYIQPPAHNRRTLEGRLLMADFKETDLRCRVHPSVGGAVLCEFDEELAEAVYENLRCIVRVTGEAEEDPASGSIKRLRIEEIEPLDVEAMTGEATFPGEFWQGRPVEELASEQGVSIPQDVDSLIGAGGDLWEDDEEFRTFVRGIYERRRADRQAEERKG